MRSTTSGLRLLSAAALVAATAAVGLTGAPPASAAATYRAQYHFTVPDHWKNDPQRPVYVNGEFNYYYLYNADYPSEVGTAWRLATTTDGVAFADQGIAAPKKTNANHDLWSGSAVVDTANTAGFGAGAVVQLVTQMDHPTPAQIANGSGPQAQFLWYSIDGGRTFRPYGDTPVIPNGGRRDFRDPKVIRDAARGRWVAAITEGDRIGFFTSPDLKTWTWQSDLVGTTGTLECPDLYPIRADDGTTHWVLGVSAGGTPGTYAYWTGSFDGNGFTADAATPQWLDHGFDWYAGVTWEDPAAPADRRFGMAWMNNWAYPDTTPTWASDGFNGTDSIVRRITLKHYADGYALASQPTPALASHASSVTNLGTIRVDDGLVPLAYHGTAYQLDTDVSWTRLENIGLQLRASADGTRHADAGIYHDYSYLNRRQTGSPDTSGVRGESHAPWNPAKTSAHLRILVDRTTIEVFVDDGRYVHSSEVFADPADTGINLYATGGSATFANTTVTEFPDLSQRPAHVVSGFEGSSYDPGWTTTGSLAGTGPSAGYLPGMVGNAVLDTFAGGGDPATGTITSPPFALDRNHLRFLIAGGHHPPGSPGRTSIDLVVNGQVVRTATGDDTGVLKPVDWDIGDLAGQSAQVQVTDQATGAWGHLMVDQLLLSD
ncbi:glycoside hydrolase family 32 protein [Amycolatopsis sp. DG1A-15b]|uniref:glycoside hydrolase family 32 protein n=1 Tax=Amycolatopsis sp. DG1A-15b TaxID=3052846 RepID=UPI00255B8A41|nr:glycoside hydrolase family 32 protein [Amycolatopsis sp. DG1A-15b]WIX92082.1 glycoside hydrolase family 32 protein [Amycolatopsis sp. DG1A-15b]